MIKHLCILLLFSASISAQNNSEWDKLIKSAHNVGFCLYNTEDVFCDAHKSRYDELMANRNDDEEELHYFTMQEEWAKKRVNDWAEKKSLPSESLILFFNINQRFDSDLGQLRTKPSSFFVVNLKDDLQFRVLNTYKKKAMSCTIFHNSKPNMLYNVLWREFMSGRLGLLENKVEFVVYNKRNVKRNFKVFKKQFFKYRKSKTD